MPHHKDFARSIPVIVGYQILSEICGLCKSVRNQKKKKRKLIAGALLNDTVTQYVLGSHTPIKPVRGDLHCYIARLLFALQDRAHVNTLYLQH